MYASGILYTVTTATSVGDPQLSFIGSMGFMDSVGFGWDADDALQNMGVDRVTQYGVHVDKDWGITYETRSHWLLPVAQCN